MRALPGFVTAVTLTSALSAVTALVLMSCNRFSTLPLASDAAAIEFRAPPWIPRTKSRLFHLLALRSGPLLPPDPLKSSYADPFVYTLAKSPATYPSPPVIVGFALGSNPVFT